MKYTLALALLCLGAPCLAQTALPPPAAPATERGEPNVKYTVIEDRGSKIDELRVRGQVQHVVVTPKVGLTRPYEIIVSRSGRDPVDGTGGANSALGKRVWNVLDF
jgi:Protein of unknown function (DUF2782)